MIFIRIEVDLHNQYIRVGLKYTKVIFIHDTTFSGTYKMSFQLLSNLRSTRPPINQHIKIQGAHARTHSSETICRINFKFVYMCMRFT